MLESPISQLLLILLGGWYLGRLFRKRFDLPPMLGELIAGLILGPTLLDIIHPSEYIEFLAELGVFFLMFYAGVETDPKLFFKSIKPSILCGIFGFIIPFALGYYGTLILMPDATLYQALFIATGLAITAIAVNARILMDLNMHNNKIGHVLIGAALVDDILALGFFSAFVNTINSGHFSYVTIGSSMLSVILFFLITYGIGKLILPMVNRFYVEKEGHGFTFSLLTALIFSVIAEVMGLHMIIGAFLAGLFVREEMKDPKVLKTLNDRLMTIGYGFLGPVFFVSLAFHVKLIEIYHEAFFLLIILAIALGGKFIGSYIGCMVAKMRKEDSMIVSAGMNGRGAVELVLVSVGVKLGILNNQIVTILVSMAFITTLLTPLAFKYLLRKYDITPDEH